MTKSPPTERIAVDNIELLSMIPPNNNMENNTAGALPIQRTVSPEKSLTSIIHKFGTETTAHGIPRIASARSNVKRLLWAAVFLAGAAASVRQFIILVLLFIDYPIDVQVEVVSQAALKFPAVTVCNTNKLRSSAVRDSQYRELVTSVEGTEILPYYVPCLEEDFICSNGIMCIKSYLVCDGAKQCPDGSDEEEDCYYGECGSNFYRCESGSPYGVCLPTEKHCDGFSDCYGGEDERNCVCQDQEFNCESPGNHGRCLPYGQICDGIEHCLDGADERGCDIVNGFLCDDDTRQIPLDWICDRIPDCQDYTDETGCSLMESCLEGQFTCTNKMCILRNKVCDLVNDCGDWSDEVNCTQVDCADGMIMCPDGKCVHRLDRCQIYVGCNETNCQATSSVICPGVRHRCLNGDCVTKETVCEEDNLVIAVDGYPRGEFRKSVNVKLSGYEIKTLHNVTDEECLIACLDYDDEQCRAVNYVYINTTCQLKSESSLTTHTDLIEETGVDYYESIIGNYPYNKFNKHERRALKSYLELKLVKINVFDCLMACLNESRFPCRSVDYYHPGRICYLSTETAWTVDVQLVATGNYDHFEVKEGVYPYNQFQNYIGFQSTLLHSTTLFNVTLNECLNQCLRETLFDCQSVDYATNGDCYLNADTLTTTSGSLVPNNEYEFFNVKFTSPFNKFSKKFSSALTSYNDAILRGIEVDECMRYCLLRAPFLCNSVDYTQSSTCFISTKFPEETDTGLGTYYRTNYYRNLKASCIDDDFACDHGLVCLKRQLVCDKNVDCDDFSDEKYCDYYCGENEFRCEFGGQTGVCIDKTKLCDGIRDCYRGTDESLSSCVECRGFLCESGQCVSANLKCNHAIDCVDGSDEVDCLYPSCHSHHQHTCLNKMCIDSFRVCDGINDCGDWSEEVDCAYRGECYTMQNGYDYRGKVNTTTSGRTCQAWTSTYPHTHDRTSKTYPGTGLGDHNYCRNPDKEPTVWCFTTDPDVRWEYCDAGNRESQCGKPATTCEGEQWFRCNNLLCVNSTYVCDGRDHCGDQSDELNCGQRGECHIDEYGQDYRGIVNHTESGRLCQKWSHQTPHKHNYPPQIITGKGIGDHNYCRLPSVAQGQVKPWCYTTDIDVRWEHCNVGNPQMSCSSGKDSTCLAVEFTCQNGQCVPRENRCDGDHQCIDGSDEENCKYFLDENGKCPTGTFTCTDGSCINEYYRCNVRVDCLDGSDEVGCIPEGDFGIGCYRGRGDDYRGLMNRTSTGLPCLPWSLSRSRYTPSKVPGSGLDGNYCRNPSTDSSMTRPWCYHEDDSGDGVGQQDCDIPTCHQVQKVKRSSNIDTKWKERYYHLLKNKTNIIDDFEANYYLDPGFDRVKGEVPPDWYGFMTFSSTPDFSDLQGVLKLSRQDMLQLGHQAEDFILHCVFEQRPCNDSDFREFANKKYGNCYTFNHGINGSVPRLSTRAGANNGLKLTLFTEQNEYISIFGQDSGVRVTLNQPGLEPFPQDEGFNVRPGTVTTVSVKEGQVNRLSKPYGNCTHGNPDVFDQSEGWGYTTMTCIKQCIRKTLLTECGCIDTFTDDGPPCLITNTTQETCRQLMYYLLQRNNLPCECRSPCIYSWYSKTISQSYWPSDNYLQRLLKELHAKNNKTKIIQGNSYAQRNLVRLEIYFEDLNYERIQEKPSYHIENLIGDIGGSLGLYIGLSLITVVEFFEFLWDIAHFLCYASQSKQNYRDKNGAI